MPDPDRARPPGLFRSGDLGVSSEWRDISYDWSPVLTATGVFVYSFLRDSYDQQRNLRPFLVQPQGPTKRSIQTKLGLKTAFALHGPEYLLATVGLLHVEVVRGALDDPERPNATNVAYYTVGRLDHPVLDWPMLDRLLDALIIALEENVTAEVPVKHAQAAVRALGQSGMLQDCDPEDLFYAHGAWPNLLTTLIHDARWVRLFTHLHGAHAITPYRAQARAWIEVAQRTGARLTDDNDRIRDLVLDAQRHPPRGSRFAGDRRSAARDTTQTVLQQPGTSLDSPGTCSAQALQLNQTASVAEMSPETLKALQLNQSASGTTPDIAHRNAMHDDVSLADHMSLCGDPLINGSGKEKVSNDLPRVLLGDRAGITTCSDPTDQAVGSISAYLRDAESTSTRYDQTFWRAVNHILTGAADRYPHTEAEKKAAIRAFKHHAVPIGAVLAALRAAVAGPAPPHPLTFGAAIRRGDFHAYLQQAIALLPARLTPATDTRGWFAFLDAYRSLGQHESLRNVSVPDYHTLKALFDRQSDACWNVLSNIEHAEQPITVTPRYLYRAIENNLRLATQHALMSPSRPPDCRPDGPRSSSSSAPAPADEPRAALLRSAGVRTSVLKPEWTESYITAWIAEADTRADVIKDRVGWLIWGLRSGCLPADHPHLQRHSPAPAGQRAGNQALGAPAVRPIEHPAAMAHRRTWEAVVSTLKDRMPLAEFDTWITDTALIDLADGNAIIGTPNVFAREKLQGAFGGLIAEELHTVLGYPVIVQIVICEDPLPMRVHSVGATTGATDDGSQCR